MTAQTRKRKRRQQAKRNEENDDSTSDDSISEESPEPVGRQKRKQQKYPELRLNCDPHNLWHLRFGHPSTTHALVLGKTKLRICYEVYREPRKMQDKGLSVLKPLTTRGRAS